MADTKLRLVGQQFRSYVPVVRWEVGGDIQANESERYFDLIMKCGD